MVEGVMLSDSELLLEDGEEGEECEHGEIMDFAEEDVLNVGKHEVGDQGDTSAQSIKEAQIEMEGQVDGVGEEANKKKIAQTGDDAAGGAAKKRLAPTFVSPRKKLQAKAAAKAGEKGAKKAYTKPKNPSG
ncbi:BnaC07g06760D [Brassica napus]|uniref:BnaC07g06760D protein n=2 Tax=Brassica napus TaxID=3708 RepID=A0A078G741_BRANA|nr:BnaC07g06760D [Brassica napus]